LRGTVVKKFTFITSKQSIQYLRLGIEIYALWFACWSWHC